MVGQHRLILTGALLLLGAVAVHCGPEDATSAAYLIVTIAERQPETPALGTVIVVQQQGGSFLRIKTSAGTHSLSSDDAGAAGRTVSCIAAPGSGKRLLFNVAPAEAEASLYVDLLGAPASPAETAAPDCSGAVLDSAFIAVTTVRQNQASGSGQAGGGGGGGGGGSTTGAGGTGGAAGAGGM